LDTSWFTPVVLANHAEPVTPDGPAVFRCWHNFREEHLDSLLDRIVLEQLELLVIQFNFAFFNLQALADLLEQLFERNIGVVIFLHAVADAFMDGKTASLASIAPTLARADQIMVHTPADIKALYDAGLSDNVTLFPHGVQLLTDQKREQTRQNYGLSNLRVIGSYGFILPHKGILELIEAFALLQSQQQDLHLLLVNALYPHPGSEETLQRCQDAIRQLGLDNCITLISDYLEDQESLSLLAACDLIVFPYQYTQESSSAAVRLAVASWQPIACTPLAIFSDVQPLVHQLPGMTPELLAQGIAELLAGDMMPDEMLANRTRWIEEHAWVRSGRQLSRILRTIWVEHCTKVNDTLSPLDHTQ
jgi:glycosyltransferase involved in cell wall biosynthesis